MGELTLLAGPDSITGTKDPRLGIAALRVKCSAENLSDAIFAPCPDVGLGLVENQPRTFTRRPAGDEAGYEVLITLEGATVSDETEGERWTIEGTTSEDAIESHPDYQQLLEIYGGAEEAGTGRAKWPKTLSTRGSEKAERNPMHGVESYLVPGLVLTREYTAEIVPSELTRGLGTIDNPPTPRNAKQVLRLDAKRNWLKVRGRATWRGNIWVIEESWLLSGPFGFVWEVYRYQRLV
jgi:hypothetical protein